VQFHYRNCNTEFRLEDDLETNIIYSHQVQYSEHEVLKTHWY